MKRLVLLVAGWLIAATVHAGSAAQPLVSVDWLKERLDQPGIVILEVAGRSRADFAKAHIPGSVFSDYAKDGWRIKNAQGVAGVMPPADKLAALIGRLGIGNDSHVVLVPLGQSAADLGSATRVYWTLKTLGHDQVSILDGGLLAWVKDVDKATKKPLNPLASGLEAPTPQTFTPNLRSDFLATKADVRAALEAGTPLIDNRENDFYLGLSKSSKAEVSGTVPGAANLPHTWLTDNNGGHLRTAEQLAQLYRIAQVPTEGPQITFCNTGHLASVGWFVSSEILGNRDAKLYDGSMAEWTRDESVPIERKIELVE